MNQITENLSAFFAHPATIAISTALIVGIYALVIFSKTSLGKKLFGSMRNMAASAVAKSEEAKEEYKKALAAKDESIADLKADYEDKLSCVLSELGCLENLITEIGNTSPNKRIQGIVTRFDSEKSERWDEISEKVKSAQSIEELKAIARSAKEEADAEKNLITAEYEALKDEVEGLLKELRERAEKPESVA